jgi:hypothetical protein
MYLYDIHIHRIFSVYYISFKIIFSTLLCSVLILETEVFQDHEVCHSSAVTLLLYIRH